MAVSAFRSTSKRTCDIRGVEHEVPATPRSRHTSPTRHHGGRSMSRNTSPVRRSASRNPSPSRRSMARNPSPTRRSASRNPSPTRRSMSRNPSPTRRSTSRNPSPTRRSMSRNPAHHSERSMSVSRTTSPTRRMRGTSRGPSPTRRSVSGTSPTRRSISGTPSTPSYQTHTQASTTKQHHVASTPRSRATSPEKAARKPIGRTLSRTQSFAEVSLSPYLSDAATVVSDTHTVGGTPRHNSKGAMSSPRTLPSDSESETDQPSYLRRLDRRIRRDMSSDTESTHSSKSTHRRASGQRAGSLRRGSNSSLHMELRRSLNQLELSDASTPVYYQKSKPMAVEDHHSVRDDEEGQVEEKTVEEKTIQEVHTQTKLQTLCYNCLYDVSATADLPSGNLSPIAMKAKVLGSNSVREPPTSEADFVTLYNARCEEVRRSISDARTELEHVKEPHLRKGLEAKLEESERKISELWSQYSTEEQKCLHLVKSLKDGKPLESDELEMDSELELEPEPYSPEMLKHRRSGSIDDADFIRQSLDAEAARYFEECVIIANFDANVVDDISVSSGSFGRESSLDNDVGVVGESLPELRNTLSSSSLRRDSSSKSLQLSRSLKDTCAPLDDEGMLLPWLDWEPEFDVGRKERLEKAVYDFREWKKAWERKSVAWSLRLNRERGKDEGEVNVDEYLFERTRLQPHIVYGRIIVCGGKR